MHFLNPKTDYAFKKIFGSDASQDILVSFLNAVLDLCGDEVIVEVTILQSITSYFMSGWVKILRPEWRSGQAMTIFLNGAIYGPLPEDHLLRNPRLAFLGSWAFIFWECAFPFALINPAHALGFCMIAGGFHFLVFWFFGLNRFFWAWMCSFPAIIWCAGQRFGSDLGGLCTFTFCG